MIFTRDDGLLMMASSWRTPFSKRSSSAPMISSPRHDHSRTIEPFSPTPAVKTIASTCPRATA